MTAVVALTVAGGAGRAAAHASVVTSSPAAGAHLGTAPTTVSVVFDQPVRPDGGGLVVLDSSGTKVGIGAGHPSPDTLTASLPANLPDGAYVANYTVTSADGHVVSGGVVFLVGNASPGQVGSLTRGATPGAGPAGKVGQFLLSAGVLVAIGLAFFLAFVLGRGPERERLRRLALGAAAVGAVGMVTTAAAQTALVGGTWGALPHWTVVRQAVGGKFGLQCAVQVIGLAACLWSTRRPTTTAGQFAAFYGLLVAAGAFVIFAHASVSPERWLSIPADVVHVVFAAMWLGGLTGLVVVLANRARTARQAGERGPVAVGGDGEPPAGAEISVLESTVRVVGRFSTLAMVSVSVLVVAGILLAVAEVGSFPNLVDTGYGQTLLVKVAAVGSVLFVAAYNRLLLLPVLARHGSGPAGSPGLGPVWRRLLGTVRVEAVGVVVVLAVTAVLTNGTPSNGARVPSLRPVPFAQTQPFEGGSLSLRISPNQALVNDFVVQFSGPEGAPVDAAESVSVYLTLPSENVGPIVTDMTKAGVGRFVLLDTPDPPIVGTWQITLQIQVSPFSQPDAGFVDAVR